MKCFLRRLFLTSLLTLLTASSAFAQGPGVEVFLVSPPITEAGPGEIVNLSFRVGNYGETEELFQEELRLPDGWRPVMPPRDFTLAPGQETTRIATIQIPRTARAGDYELYYSATSRRDYALSDEAVGRVAVRPVYALDLRMEGRAPERVLAGETFDFSVRLVNRGNAGLSVTMDARPTGRGEASVTPRMFRLPSGESRVLTVSARANPDEDRLRRAHVRIEANTDQEVDGRPVTARMSVPVDVVPLVAGEDEHIRYPVEFLTRFGGDDNDMGLQFGLEGDGYIDEARQRRLAFLIQAPDRQGKGVLSRRDEYWLRYDEPGYGVKAGDQSYALSPLTSWHRYGRGIGVDIHPEDQRLGGGIYHVQDRWQQQKRKDTGAYLSYALQPDADLRLNALFLDYDAWQDTPSFRENIVSLQGDVVLPREDELEAEIGFSDSDQTDEEIDHAWRIAYRSPGGRDFRYALSGRRAESGYAGRYGDSAWYSGSLSFPLVDPLRGSVSVRRYERNLDRAEERTAPRENLYKAGVNARLPARWTVGIDYDHYDRRDSRPEPSYTFLEHGLRLHAGRSAGIHGLGYRAEARRSWTENRLTDETFNGWNYHLSATYRPHRDLYLSAYGRFGDDEAPGESRLLRQGRTYGGTLRWQATRDFSTYASYSRSDRDFPDEPLRERVESDQYRAGFDWRMPGGQRLEASVRRSEGSNRDAYTSYAATLRIPFGVPVGRKQSVGALTGRVYRADAPGAPGIKDAIVYVGDTAAVTDSTGRFVFRTLKPGTYDMHVDERSIGIDSVPANPGSRRVTVSGGKTRNGDIGVVRSGSLAGRVAIDNNNNNNSGNNALNGERFSNNNNNNRNANDPGAGIKNGLGNILVEVSRPGETRRTVTNRKGEFLFHRLLPGDWTLRVYDHNLPAHHELEAARQTVTVEPGAELQTFARVVPRQRQIRFIDGGRVSVNSRQPD